MEQGGEQEYVLPSISIFQSFTIIMVSPLFDRRIIYHYTTRKKLLQIKNMHKKSNFSAILANKLDKILFRFIPALYRRMNSTLSAN